ncbi:MAG TPA: tRNA guanosine(34) transglycosylase Tgt, partial [Acidimicrobiales bacterium]|nr:tRNA guanosine(34) transglycosylase Tgt [Acidimicrobiales bacterium]
GETPDQLISALTATVPELPAAQPRYLMGVGDPVTLMTAMGLGVDMFDCVLPTRLARHGTALTSAGKLAVKAGRYASSSAPIDPACTCPVCQRHSRAYLRHLFNVGEPGGGRLVSLHNIAWLLGFVRQAREAIIQGRFAELAREVDQVWGVAQAGPGPGGGGSGGNRDDAGHDDGAGRVVTGALGEPLG